MKGRNAYEEGEIIYASEGKHAVTDLPVGEVSDGGNPICVSHSFTVHCDMFTSRVADIDGI
jgi:hypothetical protein